MKCIQMVLGCALIPLFLGCSQESNDAPTQPVQNPPMVVVESVSIDPGPAQILPSEMYQLTATAMIEGGRELDVTRTASWVSSDPAIADFDAATPGQLTGISRGTVTITATVTGIVSDEILFRIGADPSVVEIRPGGSATANVNENIALTAHAIIGEMELDVTADAVWSSSDSAVATVEAGQVSLIAGGRATITAEYGGVVGEFAVRATCEYPAHTGNIGFQQVFPPLGWPTAYLADGSEIEFSFDSFHCDAAYQDKSTVIVVLGAGWCTACTHFTQNILNPQAEALLEMGTEIVYVEAQDASRRPADSRYAQRHIDRMIPGGPGFRVGDNDTTILNAQGEHEPSPMFITNQPIVTAFPSVWVVRRSDMQMIADQGRGNYYLPLEMIVQDPERDWSVIPEPEFMSNCEEGDDEIYEPNDTAEDAATIRPGVVEGGICERGPDYYRIRLNGAWRATIDFSHSQGDLDMVLWDKNNDTALLDENGAAIVSNSAGDQEMIEFEGSAFLMIYGYNGASATYTLTLEER